MGNDMTPKAKEKHLVGAIENFKILVDVEVLLSLMCFMPLFNAIHCLIKFLQSRDVFICDFLQVVKVCQSELAYKYIDIATTFKREDLYDYYEILEQKHDPLPMKCRNLHGKSRISHLYFDFAFSNIYLQCHNKVMGNCLFVTSEEFYYYIDIVETQFACYLTSTPFFSFVFRFLSF